MRHRAVLCALCAGLVSVPAIVSAQAQAPPQRSVAASSVAASVAPAGFSDSVVGEVPLPTALAWTPDGRMLVTAKAGRLLVVENGAENEVALDLTSRVCSLQELGLVGLAVDPEFESNQFVYLYYTDQGGGTCDAEGGSDLENRVGRFVLGDDNTIDPSSEKVIVDHIVSPGLHHISGDLEFGANGYLYISVGDGVCTVTGTRRCGPTNDNSQVRRVPNGKILRVDRDGLAAPNNPYVDAPGARRCTDPAGVPAGTGPCEEIFAVGFRNPFRFARMPGTSAFYVNDVGLHKWEEVDRLVAGQNYGWNVREGRCVRGSTTDCGPAPYANPLYAYQHTEACVAITGGAFVPEGLWPGFDGAYLFADYACGAIWRLDAAPGGGFGRSPFMSETDGPVHLRFGPYGDTQALYYLSIFTDTVHRVSMEDANTAPVAAFDYTPDGKQVAFFGAESGDGDSDDDVVSWDWDFGDGSAETTTVPETNHTYATGGPFEVTLTVADSHGLVSDPVTETVYSGEHPPAVSITGAAVDSRFSAGQVLTLTAAASDPEDGELPGTSLRWTVRRAHADHFHPFLEDATGGSVEITYPEPEDLEAAGDSRLVVSVMAADSRGLQTTVAQPLFARKIRLGFATVPEGGRVVVEGSSFRTPGRVLSWAGHVFPVRVRDQRIDGRLYTFRKWSDGNPRAHKIVTPQVRTRYVATLIRK